MSPHPYIAELLMRLAAAPRISSSTPAEARAGYAAGRAHLGPAAPIEQRADVMIPTRNMTVPGRWLIPGHSLTGTILYLHGGGWVVGGLDDFEVLCRRLAQLSRYAVLMLDYRLAPEHPFPAGLNDTLDALNYVATRANGPIVIAGDSAGANLATVAARKTGLSLAGQVLFYPLAGSNFETESYRKFGTGWPLTKADMLWFFGHYAPPDAWRSPDIAPLLSPDLSGMPPVFIAIAEYDVLASEGRGYAHALMDQGVEVMLHEAHGMAHGYLRQHNFVEEADETLRHAAEAIGKMMSAEREQST